MGLFYFCFGRVYANTFYIILSNNLAKVVDIFYLHFDCGRGPNYKIQHEIVAYYTNFCDLKSISYNFVMFLY